MRNFNVKPVNTVEVSSSERTYQIATQVWDIAKKLTEGECSQNQAIWILVQTGNIDYGQAAEILAAAREFLGFEPQRQLEPEASPERLSVSVRRPETEVRG